MEACRLAGTSKDDWNGSDRQLAICCIPAPYRIVLAPGMRITDQYIGVFKVTKPSITFLEILRHVGHP
jgi:hypothetical protein